MPIDPAEVFALVKEGSAGAPHVAQVMVDRGYVKSVREAVRPGTLDDGPANVPRKTVHARRGRAHHSARARRAGAGPPGAREPRRSDPGCRGRAARHEAF